jgi:hypothetical protein
MMMVMPMPMVVAPMVMPLHQNHDLIGEDLVFVLSRLRLRRGNAAHERHQQDCNELLHSTEGNPKHPRSLTAQLCQVKQLRGGPGPNVVALEPVAA